MYNNNSTIMELKITGEPETRFTNGGLEVCKVNAGMMQGKPSEKRKPLWITIEAWKYQAKCLASLKKGDSVTIVGSLKQEFWGENDEKSKLVVTADSIAKKVWAPKVQEQGYNPTANYPQQQNVPPVPPQIPQQHQMGQDYNQFNETVGRMRQQGQIGQELNQPPVSDDIPF